MSRPAWSERDLHRQVGERIRALRTDRGWTQETLAERAQLDRSYLANLEAGGRNPTLAVLARLAHALEVTLPDLFADIQI